MRTNELISSLFNNPGHQHQGCGSYDSRPFFEGLDKETLPGVPFSWSDANAYANPNEGFEEGDEKILGTFLKDAPLGFKVLKDNYHGSNLDGFSTYEKVEENRWEYTFEEFEG